MSAPGITNRTKVLIVDDSATVRQQVRHALVGSEFSLIEAADGVEGWAAMMQHPDLAVVICDVNMPRMDGLQLLEHAKGAAFDVPVVMLTTEGQPELVKRARESGARGWMVKPVAPEHLLKVITKLAHRAA